MIGRTISHNRVVSQLGGGWVGEVNGTGDLTLQLHVVLNFPPLEMKNDLMPVNACSAKRLLHRRSESPVKIELDLRENEDQLLRMGMSVQPEVWPR